MLNTLQDLYLEALRDLYDAEQQLLKALPVMEKSAEDESLKIVLGDHLRQTEIHAERLACILEPFGEQDSGRVSKAMKSLIAEGGQYLAAEIDPMVKDAALIAIVQRVEHYEIACYGTVRTFAELLGFTRAAGILQQTLSEEAGTDERLTEIARTINVEALACDRA
ncbi:MAG TPA: ferritin-like domain-containing protein [Opitutaceae bacterium]|nr:ferritin-like domain-containing protein [Opitutaceae bacterium]